MNGHPIAHQANPNKGTHLSWSLIKNFNTGILTIKISVAKLQYRASFDVSNNQVPFFRIKMLKPLISQLRDEIYLKKYYWHRTKASQFIHFLSAI